MQIFESLNEDDTIKLRSETTTSNSKANAHAKIFYSQIGFVSFFC